MKFNYTLITKREQKVIYPDAVGDIAEEGICFF
jgi:hypothetical protein